MTGIITNAKFEFFIENTYSRDFTVSGWSLPIDGVFFTVKENEKNKRAVLQKTLKNGITLVSDEDGVKTYNLLIDNTDTERMKTDFDYFCDVEIQSIGTDGKVIPKTIIVGTLKLKPASTRKYNE